MRILIGVDDSPHSQAALDFVKKMAWPAGTTVQVISVARPQVSAFSEVYAPSTPYIEQLWQSVLEQHQAIATAAAHQLEETGFVVEARVIQGDPREALVEAARSERPDLLVMGSHGRSGFTKLMMGSVASHVLTHAPCHVLVVKLERPS